MIRHLLAYEALDTLVFSRLLDIEEAEMVEKVVIARFWITISSSEVETRLERMQEIIKALSKKLPAPFGPSAAHAAQAVCQILFSLMFEADDYASCFGSKSSFVTSKKNFQMQKFGANWH